MTDPVDTPTVTPDELLGSLQPATASTQTTASNRTTAASASPPALSIDETAEKVIRKLRDEAAANRVKANEAQAAKEAADAEWATKVDEAAQAAAKQATDEIAQKFGKMFGLVDDKTEQTPEQLLAQAQAKAAETEAQAAAKIADAEQRAAENEAKARAKDVALTVHQHAGDDVDVRGLLDSVEFNGRIAKLDPTAADFASQMDAEIGSFLQANPRFRKTAGLATTIPRSGGSFDAGNAAPPSAGEPSVDQLLKQVQAQRGPGNRASRSFRNE
ncbi:hypothetical protein ACIP5Y_21565 [Nocardia sp. NPDC088792]|uniref:hypothetical protein n=1 Tax=Nocardia sp. NPDC088792 TaxID=3364332 RepID=UPI00380BA125